MDIYKEVREAFVAFGENFDVIFVEKNREKFPEAGYMPSSLKDHKVFVLKYNNSALIRWAIWEIVMHEVAHKKLYEMGYENWKEHDEKFWSIYIELRKIFEEKVAEIYGG